MAKLSVQTALVDPSAVTRLETCVWFANEVMSPSSLSKFFVLRYRIMMFMSAWETGQCSRNSDWGTG
jgi:hypothetical protein